MTFPVLIHNANIFRDRSPPGAFSLGHPSAAAPVQEGSYQSLQTTLLQRRAVAAAQGCFCPPRLGTSTPHGAPGKGLPGA